MAVDENNYYVTRANALEDNVRLYYMANGKRYQFASWSGRVSSGYWHELRADANGEHSYVDAFMQNIDWQKVAALFTNAAK